MRGPHVFSRVACAALVAAALAAACDTPYRHLRRAGGADASSDGAMQTLPDGAPLGTGGRSSGTGGTSSGNGGTSNGDGGSGAAPSGGAGGDVGASGGSSPDTATGGATSTDCTTPGIWDTTNWDRACWQ